MKTTCVLIVVGFVLGFSAALACGTKPPVPPPADSTGLNAVWSAGFADGKTIDNDDGENESGDGTETDATAGDDDANELEHSGIDAETGETETEAEHRHHDEMENDGGESGEQETEADDDDANENDPGTAAINAALADSLKLNLSAAKTGTAPESPATDISAFSTDRYTILPTGIAGPVGNVVPEPTTIILLGAGMLGLAGIARKKFTKRNA